MAYEIETKSGRLLSQARELLPSTAAVTGKSRRDSFQTQAGEMDWHKVAIWSPRIRPVSFQGEEAWKKVKLQALTPVTRAPLAFPFMVPGASWGRVAVVGRALLLNGNQFSSKVRKDLWQQTEYTPANPAHPVGLWSWRRLSKGNLKPPLAYSGPHLYMQVIYVCIFVWCSIINCGGS